jgi:hypothetical protein
MLLARFFAASMLSEYCEARLGKSGKGSEAILAARIAREWSKPSFLPLPSSSGSTENPPAKKQKRSCPAQTAAPEAAPEVVSNAYGETLAKYTMGELDEEQFADIRKGIAEADGVEGNIPAGFLAQLYIDGPSEGEGGYSQNTHTTLTTTNPLIRQF